MVTIIATIIHMNMGFEMPEALGRGIVSAIVVWAVMGVLCFIAGLISSMRQH